MERQLNIDCGKPGELVSKPALYFVGLVAKGELVFPAGELGEGRGVGSVLGVQAVCFSMGASLLSWAMGKRGLLSAGGWLNWSSCWPSQSGPVSCLVKVPLGSTGPFCFPASP